MGRNIHPQIESALQTPDEYEVIFLGYPIWNGHAPRIIYTFLDTYDFTEKEKYLFATSISSSMVGGVEELHAEYPQNNFLSYAEIIRLENGLASVRYDGEYGFNGFLENGGASSDIEVIGYLRSNLFGQGRMAVCLLRAYLSKR